MCLLLLQYRTLAAAPVLLAANREEFFNRPTEPPQVSGERVRVMCGIDRRAGGTWLGVNEHGLAVAVTNRMKGDLPAVPRSRGLLCRELLGQPGANEAVKLALDSLRQGAYAGVNLLCADRDRAVVIHAGDAVETVELAPGVHLLTNGDVNDPSDGRQVFARSLWAARYPTSIERFAETARYVLSQGPDPSGEPTILLRGPDRGTVSSSIVAVARDPSQSLYHFAAGSPDQQPYDDLSPLLREMLKAGPVEAVS